MSKDYYEFTDEKVKYYNLQELDNHQVLTTVLQYLAREKRAKMRDLASLFEGKLSRRQVRFRVDKLVKNGMLKQEGEGSTSIYEIGENSAKEMEVVFQSILGLNK